MNQNILNNEFGNLRAISIKRDDFVCLCSCGLKILVNQEMLTDEIVNHCSCNKKYNGMHKKKIGLRFGMLTIKNIFLNDKKLLCMVQCDCGDKKILSFFKVVQKQIAKHCGCRAKQELLESSKENKKRLNAIHIVQSMSWS